MKVSEACCGNKSEAQPFYGQTCLIAPAHGATAEGEGI